MALPHISDQPIALRELQEVDKFGTLVIHFFLLHPAQLPVEVKRLHDCHIVVQP